MLIKLKQNEVHAIAGGTFGAGLYYLGTFLGTLLSVYIPAKKFNSKITASGILFTTTVYWMSITLFDIATRSIAPDYWPEQNNEYKQDDTDSGAQDS